jgi:hypothetical protein
VFSTSRAHRATAAKEEDMNALATITAAVLASGSAVMTAPAASAATGCTTGALPSSVVGNPLVRAGDPAAVYLWHDSHGYHVRATHPGSARVVISGSITASRDIASLRRVALESADVLRLSNHNRTLSFRFVNAGRIDGFDFTASCARTARFAFRVGASTATPRQVHLGAHRVSPTSVPFTVERT